jgi:hypothetical protein
MTLIDQALGVWEFDLGVTTHDRTESCGYQRPDDNVQHFTSYKYDLSKYLKSSIQVCH